ESRGRHSFPTRRSSDLAVVRVSVHDEGPGLMLSEQQHIWERFYRAEGIEVKSGSGVGLGLGLHICRTLIERQGGQVGVESAPGRSEEHTSELQSLRQLV